MRNSAFWCDDSLVEPYVLWCYGWYWDRIEAVVDDDRRLSLENVRMLLGALLNDEPRFPTRGGQRSRHGCRGGQGMGADVPAQAAEPGVAVPDGAAVGRRAGVLDDVRDADRWSPSPCSR